ncbi:MAG: hypothetical protein ACKVZJ_01055 [Phycisphaerales bacterium]
MLVHVKPCAVPGVAQPSPTTVLPSPEMPHELPVLLRSDTPPRFPQYVQVPVPMSYNAASFSPFAGLVLFPAKRVPSSDTGALPR